MGQVQDLKRPEIRTGQEPRSVSLPLSVPRTPNDSQRGSRHPLSGGGWVVGTPRMFGDSFRPTRPIPSALEGVLG